MPDPVPLEITFTPYQWKNLMEAIRSYDSAHRAAATPLDKLILSNNRWDLNMNLNRVKVIIQPEPVPGG